MLILFKPFWRKVSLLETPEDRVLESIRHLSTPELKAALVEMLKDAATKGPEAQKQYELVAYACEQIVERITGQPYRFNRFRKRGGDGGDGKQNGGGGGQQQQKNNNHQGKQQNNGQVVR